jgi:hypothetical protein
VRVLNQNKKVNNSSISAAGIRRLLLLTVGALMFHAAAAMSVSAQASDVYITPDGGGSGVCTNNTHPPSWFNSSGNWGSGAAQIGPDTIVHLCGTITTALTAQGSGTSGHPWTLLFESGAKISKSTPPFLDVSGRSFFVIDGGSSCGWNPATLSETACNGLLEATANGTGMANHSDAHAVTCGSSHDWEFRNISMQNMYVRVPNSGDTNGSNGTLFYCYPDPVNNVHIHHLTVNNFHWGMTFNAQDSGSSVNNVEIDHVSHKNYDHGVASGIGAGFITNLLIHDNGYGTTKVWDTLDNSNHHDGVHLYDGENGLQSGSISGVQIYRNYFYGDWGNNPTGWIFFEGHINATIYNNVGISPAGTHNLANGAFNNCNSIGPHTVNLYNNTFIFLQSAQNPYMIQLCGTHDVRNNALVTQTGPNNNPFLSSGPGSGTWNYNAYASTNPGYQLFSNSGSCCVWTYAQWKTNKGADANSGAIQSPPMGLNTASGAPNTGSPVISAGQNLTSLGISALNSDMNGNARPTSGAWTIGAFNFGSSTSNSDPLPPTGLNAVVQ